MGSRRIGYDMAMAAWWLDGAFMACTFFFVEEDERAAMGKESSRRRKEVLGRTPTVEHVACCISMLCIVNKYV